MIIVLLVIKMMEEEPKCVFNLRIPVTQAIKIMVLVIYVFLKTVLVRLDTKMTDEELGCVFC